MKSCVELTDTALSRFAVRAVKVTKSWALTCIRPKPVSVYSGYDRLGHSFFLQLSKLCAVTGCDRVTGIVFSAGAEIHFFTIASRQTWRTHSRQVGTGGSFGRSRAVAAYNSPLALFSAQDKNACVSCNIGWQ
jgi:hypothetical protein